MPAGKLVLPLLISGKENHPNRVFETLELERRRRGNRIDTEPREVKDSPETFEVASPVARVQPKDGGFENDEIAA
jgi:hypothetical protein